MEENNKNVEFEQKRKSMIREIDNEFYNEVVNFKRKICQELELQENKLKKIKELKNIKEEKEFLTLYNEIKEKPQSEEVKAEVQNEEAKVEVQNEEVKAEPQNVDNNNKLIISEKERKSIFTI